MLRALDFYVGALGFEVVSRWPDDAAPPRWAALAAGGARLMLRCGHPRREIRHGGRPGVVTMNFYVEGIEAFHRELIASGYECDAIETLFYGAREFYVLDPDSNEVSIVEFAASDPGYMASPKGRTPKREPSAQKAGGRRETRAKRRTR